MLSMRHKYHYFHPPDWEAEKEFFDYSLKSCALSGFLWTWTICLSLNGQGLGTSPREARCDGLSRVWHFILTGRWTQGRPRSFKKTSRHICVSFSLRIFWMVFKCFCKLGLLLRNSSREGKRNCCPINAHGCQVLCCMINKIACFTT